MRDYDRLKQAILMLMGVQDPEAEMLLHLLIDIKTDGSELMFAVACAEKYAIDNGITA